MNEGGSKAGSDQTESAEVISLPHKSNTREGKNAVVNGEKNRKKRESERARERC